MLNPHTPFLIRPLPGANTELWVKYDHGAEEVLTRISLVLPAHTTDQMRNLDNAAEDRVEGVLRDLVRVFMRLAFRGERSCFVVFGLCGAGGLTLFPPGAFGG
jgi:hypothetical protein